MQKPPPEPIRTRDVGWPTLGLFLAVTFGVLTLFPIVLRSGPMARVILPAWLQNLVPFGTLLLLGVARALLLLVYLRTRSLWVAVGLDGLADAPTPLVQGTVSWEIPLIVLLVGWPWLARRPDHRALARVERADGGGREAHPARIRQVQEEAAGSIA